MAKPAAINIKKKLLWRKLTERTPNEEKQNGGKIDFLPVLNTGLFYSGNVQRLPGCFLLSNDIGEVSGELHWLGETGSLSRHVEDFCVFGVCDGWKMSCNCWILEAKLSFWIGKKWREEGYCCSGFAGQRAMRGREKERQKTTLRFLGEREIEGGSGVWVERAIERKTRRVCCYLLN